jgi:glycosyltransferase involved in cell wall biosynthesis
MPESGSPPPAVPVLLVVRELDLGGVERDVTKIAMHLDPLRFVPHVASYCAHGVRFEELRAAGIPVLHLPLNSLMSASAVSSALRMRRYVRQHHIRVVHSYDTSVVFVAPVARAIGVPVVISSQLGYRDLFDKRSRKELRWIDRIVDAIVVNCEAMRRHLIEDEHVPAERIELCYNGVDTSQFYPAASPRAEPVAGAPLVIGTVCVLRPEKALHLLQEAFARVRHLRPGMKLLIVGSGPLLDSLQSNSVRLGIQGDCVFQPATRSVAEFLRSIDIFVLCSYSEAFSNALLEAMACGCCTVGSAVGGTPEMLGADERGLLSRVGDSSHLAEKLALLIEDKELRQKLGLRAAAFARETLNIQIAARRTAEIYESQLCRKAGA